MEQHDKAVGLIRAKGPIIPAALSKELQINNLFASALLAELVERGVLKISKIKIGGSPLYYLPGQEDRLQEFSNYLNEKDQRAYNMLRQQKVLADNELEPLYRVAMRQIKDFAKPLEVNVGGETYIFWKWYLLQNNEAEPIIKGMLGQEQQGPVAQQAEPEALAAAQPLPREAVPSPATEWPGQQAEGQETAEAKPGAKPQKRQKKAADAKSNFLEKVEQFFVNAKIQVLEREIIKKSSEADFTLLVPSPVGTLRYYCKAKNKKRCSDLDLSAAYVRGEIKKLPVLFITTGELTKKANEMLTREFRNITVQKI